jgi:hypothetical protein
VTSESLAASVHSARKVDVALAAGLLRCRDERCFTPSGPSQEWCDRALPRGSIATPCNACDRRSFVSSQDFMRFRWQHLLPNDRREGPDALDAVISQLQGFEAPVAA